MNPKNLLIFLLILLALIGGVSGFFEARDVSEPAWWTLTSSLFISIVIFYWYRLDSNQRSFKRTIWLNIGVIGVVIVAIPGYIFLRSEPGTRLRSLARMVGFTILLCFMSFAGSMVGGLFG